MAMNFSLLPIGTRTIRWLEPLESNKDLVVPKDVSATSAYTGITRRINCALIELVMKNGFTLHGGNVNKLDLNHKLIDRESIIIATSMDIVCLVTQDITNGRDSCSYRGIRRGTVIMLNEVFLKSLLLNKTYKTCVVNGTVTKEMEGEMKLFYNVWGDASEIPPEQKDTATPHLLPLDYFISNPLSVNWLGQVVNITKDGIVLSFPSKSQKPSIDDPKTHVYISNIDLCFCQIISDPLKEGENWDWDAYVQKRDEVIADHGTNSYNSPRSRMKAVFQHLAPQPGKHETASMAVDYNGHNDLLQQLSGIKRTSTDAGLKDSQPKTPPHSPMPLPEDVRRMMYG